MRSNLGRPPAPHLNSISCAATSTWLHFELTHLSCFVRHWLSFLFNFFFAFSTSSIWYYQVYLFPEIRIHPQLNLSFEMNILQSLIGWIVVPYQKQALKIRSWQAFEAGRAKIGKAATSTSGIRVFSQQ